MEKLRKRAERVAYGRMPLSERKRLAGTLSSASSCSALFSRGLQLARFVARYSCDHALLVAVCYALSSSGVCAFAAVWASHSFHDWAGLLLVATAQHWCALCSVAGHIARESAGTHRGSHRRHHRPSGGPRRGVVCVPGTRSCSPLASVSSVTQASQFAVWLLVRCWFSVIHNALLSPHFTRCGIAAKAPFPIPGSFPSCDVFAILSASTEARTGGSRYRGRGRTSRQRHRAKVRAPYRRT